MTHLVLFIVTGNSAGN